MRSSAQKTGFQIDWDSFESVNRHQKAFEAVGLVRSKLLGIYNVMIVTS